MIFLKIFFDIWLVRKNLFAERDLFSPFISSSCHYFWYYKLQITERDLFSPFISSSCHYFWYYKLQITDKATYKQFHSLIWLEKWCDLETREVSLLLRANE
jgi:hypothetical protein